MNKKILLLFLILSIIVSTASVIAEDNEYINCPEETMDVCTEEAMPVCGDDDVTYSNACYACQSESVTKYTEGVCEEAEHEDGTCTTDAECQENYVCNEGVCENRGINPEEEEEETIDASSDDEIEKEVEAMVFPIGAKIRLIQLQISATKALIKGEIVIQYIDENIEGVDTTRMNEILDELSALIIELDETLNLEEVPEDSVEKFVELKKVAIELIKEFRDLSRDILNEEDARTLRELFRTADYSQITELNDQKKSLTREYNAQQIKRQFQRFGEDGSEFAERIRKGEISINKIRQNLKEKIMGLDKTELDNARQELTQARARFVQAKEKAKISIEKVRQNIDQAKERFRTQTEKAKTIRENIKTKITNNAEFKDRIKNIQPRRIGQRG